MAPKAPIDPGSADPEALRLIAQSVRGAFRTVEDMTHSFIREAIVQGVFAPGERLNLDAIAATLEVSRMPVRASLKQLESEGLLQIHAYRGATVSVLRPHEIAEIFELRILLETYLLGHAMDRLSDAALDSLDTVLSELETSAELGTRLERRRAFYQVLYEQADRPRALAQLNSLLGSVGRYLLLLQVDENPDHQDLMRHLRNRDGTLATGWLTAHLSKVSAMLQVKATGDEPSTEVAPVVSSTA